MNHNLTKKPFSPVNYEDLIPKQNGCVFKVVKLGNNFIHTFAEGAFMKKVQLSPEQVIGKTLHDFVPEAQAAQKLTFYEKAWSGQFINYEGCINNQFYLASLAPVIVDGKVTEIHGTILDITEHRKNAEKIQKLEKLSLIGELAAGIAHEIRNPLTSITGFAQIIKETTQDKSTDQYLNIMLDELNQISTIVNEFIFISKPKVNMAIKKVNIASLIFRVLEFQKPETLLKGLKLTACIESEHDIVSYCDPDQITQVLLNLLQNAIDASPQAICIFLKQGPGNSFSIEIKDNGAGISPERQERLFEPFYTTKEKGTGLGLMTCKRIIENHHGTIQVSSNAGTGTAVTITLPAFCEKTVHVLTNKSAFYSEKN